jgi:hypothetical protein
MTFFEAFTDELEKLAGIGALPAGTWSPKGRKIAADLLRALRRKSPRKAREALARAKGEQSVRDITSLGKKIKKEFVETGLIELPEGLTFRMPSPAQGGRVSLGIQRAVETQRRLMKRKGQKMTPAMVKAVQKASGRGYEEGMEWGLRQKGQEPPRDPADWWKKAR